MCLRRVTKQLNVEFIFDLNVKEALQQRLFFSLSLIELALELAQAAVKGGDGGDGLEAFYAYTRCCLTRVCVCEQKQTCQLC